MRQPVRALETRPLVDRAREVLLAAIREGRFPDGRLPPEEELAVTLKISRGTLRSALQTLSAEGLVTRRRRHGTFVNEDMLRSSMRLNRLVPFSALVEQAGYQASTDPQEVAPARASASQASALELEPGEPVVVARRLLRADGEPVMTVTDVLATARLTVSPGRIRSASTTFEFLARNAEIEVEYAVSDVVPRVATAARPVGLNLTRGTPFIELHEVHFDAHQRRIALSVICVVDRLVRLSLLRRGH